MKKNELSTEKKEVFTMRRSKGFTLLELITVIIIIGILAVVAFPQFVKAMERARMGTAIAKLGTLKKAQGIYHTLYSTYETDQNKLATEVPEVAQASMDDADYTFVVTAANADSWNATATKARGKYNGGVITMATDGTLTCPAGEFGDLCSSFQQK